MKRKPISRIKGILSFQKSLMAIIVGVMLLLYIVIFTVTLMWITCHNSDSKFAAECDLTHEITGNRMTGSFVFDHVFNLKKK